MSRNKEKLSQYVKELKEYAEKLKFSTNFVGSVTLASKEHKMLIEGYKSKKLSKSYNELEIADLTDYFLLERSNGGTNFQTW